MTKTSNYNLNKPEPTDPMRLADYNQNSDIIDAAIKAVEQSVAGAYGPNNLPWETGVLDLTDVDEGDVAKTFGFEPSAILLGAEKISPGFGINGGTFRMDEYSSSSRYYFTLSGNELIATTVSGAPVTELYYLALK